MKYFGLLCILLIGTGLPAHCQDDLLEVLGSEDDYAYDTVDEDQEEEDSHVAVDRPRFTVLPEVFTPRVGETVSLPCTNDRTDIADSPDVLFIDKNSKRDASERLMVVAGNLFFMKDKRFSKVNDILTIQNVKKTDSGRYNCVFQVGKERINVTHTLNVYFEPSVRPKKKVIQVESGESATLNCMVTGNPPPKITWRKLDGRMPAEKEEEEGNPIIFEDVDRHIAGNYMCTVDNGVGNPVTAEREIVVSYAPEIRTENEIVHTGNGDRVDLVCVVHAFPAAEVTWTRNDIPVDSDTLAEVHEGGHRHHLTIEDVTSDNFGVYTCAAENQYGSAAKNISITDAPSTPAIISERSSAEESSYTIAWSSQSFYPIDYYTLQYRKTRANDSSDAPGAWHELDQDSEDQALEKETTDGKHTFRHTLQDLERATDYEAVLKVANTVKPADEVTFTFSTRKALAPPTSTTQSAEEVDLDEVPIMDQETTGQQQTNAGEKVASSALVMLTLQALVLCWRS